MEALPSFIRSLKYSVSPSDGSRTSIASSAFSKRWYCVGSSLPSPSKGSSTVLIGRKGLLPVV